MFEWENSTKPNSVSISDDEQKIFKKQAKNPSADSSISGHWMSIAGRVHDEPLLEDEAVPEIVFYESSPEIDNKYENFDNTLLEPVPKWRNVSDESFVKMEQLVMSPVRTVEKISKKINLMEESNLITFSPLKVDTEKIFPVKEEVEDSTHEDNIYETCESSVSKVICNCGGNLDVVSEDNLGENEYATCVSSQSESPVVPDILVNSKPLCNTLDDVSSISEDNQTNSGDCLVPNMLDSSFSSRGDNSYKFNDTLEEMEQLIKYGMNYITEKKHDDSIEGDDSLPSTENITKRLSPKKSKNVENKENKFRLRSPRLVLPSHTSDYVTNSPFKVPVKTPTTRRFFYPKSPPSGTTPTVKLSKVTQSRITPGKITPGKITPGKITPGKITPGKCTPTFSHTPKFENILSPVQYYINNSPVVPKIKNVSPGINLWEKHSQRVASKGKVVSSPREEGALLQEKAYRSAKTTKLIETPPKMRLPRNFKAELMAEGLPKPMVIKHSRREGQAGPLREQNQKRMAGGVEDSFANLPLISGDVSLCVKKTAVRTRTLK